jgi:nitrous oxidase accessory protein NosD
MIVPKVLLLVLFIASIAAPAQAQDDSIHWWWSPGLGLYASSIDDALARDLGLARTKGMLVLAVARKSPAEEAGLKPGDIVADWSPREIWSEAGKVGTIQVVRDGKDQTLTATSRKMPDDVPVDLVRVPAETRAAAAYVVESAGGGNFRTLTGALFRSQPGDIVVIRPGIYTEGVFVPPGITIRATEKGLVRAEIKTPWLLAGPGAVEVLGIAFSGAGLAVDHADQVAISDCDFVTSEKRTGLVVRNSKAVKVMRSTFRGAAETIGLSAYGSQIVVDDSIFLGHGNTALGITRDSHAEIKGNLIDGNQNGMLVFDSEVTATGNTITGSWSPASKSDEPNIGLRLEKANATLSKNVVRRHRHGIYISNAPSPTKISESTVAEADFGIVSMASPTIISQNLIMQNRQNGIYIAVPEKESQSQPQEVTIERNTLSGNEGTAIEVHQFRNVAVRENLIEANGNGISFSQATGIIENNTLVLQRAASVYISKQSNVEIFNNVVAFNSFGVFLDVTAKWQLGFNNIYGNLASREFPLRDGNYGRSDRYITREGQKVPIDVYPAYDLKGDTDVSFDPGFVKLGTDHSLLPGSAIAALRGRGGRYLGAYAPASFVMPSVAAAEVAVSDPAPSGRRSTSAKSSVSRKRVVNPESPAAGNGVSTNSGEAGTLIDRGDELMKRSKWGEALAVYQQATEIAPNNAKAFNALGWAYNAMGRHGEAFAPLVKAIQLNSQLAEAHYGIAYAYLGSDSYAKALGFLKTAVRLKPNHVDARYSLGLACLELGDNKCALDQYNALKNLDDKLAQELYQEIQASANPQ